MISVSLASLVVEERVSGVEMLDLAFLALVKNSNLTSHAMDYLWHQVIAVDGNSEPAPENITDEVPQP